MERDFLLGSVVTGQVLNSEKLGIDGHWEEMFYCEVGEAMAEVAQRRCGCFIPGRVLRLGQDGTLRKLEDFPGHYDP